jgi:hypothetical protein
MSLQIIKISFFPMAFAPEVSSPNSGPEIPKELEPAAKDFAVEIKMWQASTMNLDGAKKKDKIDHARLNGYIKTIYGALFDKDAGVREAAATALGNMTLSPEDKERAKKILEFLKVNDPSPAVKTAAATSLNKIFPAQAVVVVASEEISDAKLVEKVIKTLPGNIPAGVTAHTMSADFVAQKLKEANLSPEQKQLLSIMLDRYMAACIKLNFHNECPGVCQPRTLFAMIDMVKRLGKTEPVYYERLMTAHIYALKIYDAGIGESVPRDYIGLKMALFKALWTYPDLFLSELETEQGRAALAQKVKKIIVEIAKGNKAVIGALCENPDKLKTLEEIAKFILNYKPEAAQPQEGGIKPLPTLATADTVEKLRVDFAIEIKMWDVTTKGKSIEDKIKKIELAKQNRWTRTLYGALFDADPRVRAAAAKALGEIASSLLETDRYKAKRILGFLVANDPAVEAEAKKALELIESSVAPVDINADAVDFLIDDLSNPNAVVRMHAIDLIIKAPLTAAQRDRAVTKLMELIANDNADFGVGRTIRGPAVYAVYMLLKDTDKPKLIGIMLSVCEQLDVNAPVQSAAIGQAALRLGLLAADMDDAQAALAAKLLAGIIKNAKTDPVKRPGLGDTDIRVTALTSLCSIARKKPAAITPDIINIVKAIADDINVENEVLIGKKAVFLKIVPR